MPPFQALSTVHHRPSRARSPTSWLALTAGASPEITRGLPQSGTHTATHRLTRRSLPRAHPNDGRTSIGVSEPSGNAQGGRSAQAFRFSETEASRRKLG